MSKKLLLLFVLMLSVASDSFSQLEYKDVAGIFYNRCTSCHHANGGAPFSMMTYSEVLPEIYNIETALLTNYMPPWPADTTYRRFAREHIITQSEKNAILSWISTGGIQGDTTLAPSAPTYSTYKLTPPPDLVLQIPTFTSNATATNDAYNLFVLPSGLATNRIIKAVEIVPGNGGIVHHVSVGADTTASSANDFSGSAFTFPANVGIGGFIPGSEPIVFPSASILKMGVTVKAGSQILLQIHYPAGSGGQQDSTQVRIYFYPPGTTGVREVYAFTPMQNWSFYMLPGEIKTVTSDTALLDWFPLSVFSSLPHSHKICTEILNYAYKASGTPDTIPLMKINDWEFHWQFYYYYRNLVKIPPGYRYHGVHVYDNTASNPHNPFSPPQTIIPGVNSNDEMFYDSFQIMVYYPGDENINIDSLLSVDPLLTASINEQVESRPWLYSFAYPNPFSQKTTIQVVSNLTADPSEENYSMEFFDAAGKKVNAATEKKENSFEISRNGLMNGIYFYRILSDGSVVSTGKIIID